MTMRPIVRLGHPALRTPADAVDLDRIPDPTFQELVDDLLETMQEHSGVGLAAPQVGIGLQLFVYATVPADGPSNGDTELKVLINPMVEPSGEQIYDWEGCLSIPDLRGLVPRHPAVRVFAHDRHGKPISYRAEGYEARIVQHEFDHLNGVIFLDRMRDLRSLCFSAEWEEFMTTSSDEEEAAVG